MNDDNKVHESPKQDPTKCLPESEPYFTRTASETWVNCCFNMRPVLERKDNE